MSVKMELPKLNEEGHRSVILMAGVRDYNLEKYLSMLISANYNVAVYIQDKSQKKIVRKLDKVYSPGTYVSFDCNNNQRLSNNIMSIWIENFKQYRSREKLLVCGASSVNIFTGDVYMFQSEKPYYMSITAFDELEKRLLSMRSPKLRLIPKPRNSQPPPVFDKSPTNPNAVELRSERS